MADIAEQICLAIDQIVSERLKSIKFDSTIIATIVDNSDAKNYRYTCSNGSAQFIAFSKDTTFKINDSVQVTIPNNDYDQQKVIVGKYVAKDAQPYVFTQPFSTIIDVSSNLITDNDEIIQGSLLANKDYDKAEFNEDTGKYAETTCEVALWSKVFETGFTDFNRLGIQGQFRSWIAALKPVSGNYGYRLEVLSDNGETIGNSGLIAKWAYIYSDIINKEQYDSVGLSDSTPASWYEKVKDILNLTAIDGSFKTAFITSFEEAQETDPYSDTCKDMVYALLYANAQITELYLDSSEMYGNPYNFQSFFEQEKVYDISSLGTIFGMSLFFYEKSATFYTEEKSYLPYTTITKEQLTPNLFTKDPYICLGYDLADFDSEQAILYTLDGDTYINRDDIDPVLNRKTIRLRWLHQYENGQIKVITEASDLEGYEIRWYRFKMGAPSADEYSGVYWTSVQPDAASKFSYTFNPAINVGQEQVKAIVLYDGKVIRSNIVTFVSEIEVINGATSAYLAGLSIWCDDIDLSGVSGEDGSFSISAKTPKNGIYYIYGQSNNLLDENKANIVLNFEAHFADASILAETYDVDLSAPLLTEATEITWEIPLSQTMIVINGFNYSFEYDEVNEITNGAIDYAKIEANDPEGKRFKLPGYFNDASIRVRNNTVYITRKGDENTQSINAIQEYRVRKTYSASYLQNTVKCSIKKHGIVYSATKELYFGIMGTNGTDATVVIDFNNNKTALTADLESETFKVTARLYDSNHNEVDFNNIDLGINCQWEWAYYYEGHLSSSSSTPVDNVANHMASYKAAYPDATRLALQTEMNKVAAIKLTTIEMDSSILSSNVCHLSHTKPLQIAMSASAGQDKFFLILKATITGYGNYDLVSYKAIPIRKNKNFRNYVGPTEIIYSTAGYANYYKEPLQLWYSESVNEYDFVTDATSLRLYGNNWDIYNPYNEVLTYIGAISPSNILTPSAIYVKSTSPYGIVCQEFNEDGGKDPVWIQPLVIMQNEYPSATLNKWDGKSLQLNEDEGYIISPAIAAGKKNSDNTFSGVMLGDWSRTDVDKEISKQTGVYGFHEGKMSYAFKEDGTGFIGKSGRGRILFNGNTGVIKSQAWDVAQSGMFLDLDDGILKLQKNSQYEEVPVTESTYAKDTYYIFSSAYEPVPLNEEWSASKDYYLYKLKDLGLLTKNDFLIKQKNNLGEFYYKHIEYTPVTTFDSSIEKYYVEGYTQVFITKEQFESSLDDGKTSTKYYILEKEYTISEGDYSASNTYYTRYQPEVVTEEQYKNSLVDGVSTKYYTKNDKGEFKPSAGDFIKSETAEDGTVSKNYYVERYEAQEINEETYKATLKDGKSTCYYLLTWTAYTLSNKSYSVNSIYYIKSKVEKKFNETTFAAYTDTIYTITSSQYILVTPETEHSEIQQYAQYAYTQCYYEVTGPTDSSWNTSSDPNFIDNVKFTSYNKGSYYTLQEGYKLDSRDSFTSGEKYYLFNNTSEQRFITLSAQENTYPLSIGTTNSVASRNFRVEWDGTVWIENGHIQGIITADELYCEYGFIGGWEITNNTLQGGKTILHSVDGIYTNNISIIDQINAKNENGLLGEIGLIYGSTGKETTYNIGIVSKNQSIVLDTMSATGATYNIALRSKGGAWTQSKTFYAMGSSWQSDAEEIGFFAPKIYLSSNKKKIADFTPSKITFEPTASLELKTVDVTNTLSGKITTTAANTESTISGTVTINSGTLTSTCSGATTITTNTLAVTTPSPESQTGIYARFG